MPWEILRHMKTVLVVEDDLNSWRVSQIVLTRLGGWVAKHTENVEEVLQMAQSGDVDLILMDVDLRNSRYQGRRINGLQITQLLKANPQTVKLPVILLTANANPGDEESLLRQSGADGYIPKPVINYREFIDRISAMLREE